MLKTTLLRGFLMLLIFSFVGISPPIDLKAGSFQSTDLQARTPIRINGDAGFVVANGVRSGSGTEDDPYIIEGWRIDGEGSDEGILIDSTTRFVIVRNCEVFDAGIGVNVVESDNVTIENCHFHDNSRGIQVLDAQNAVVRENLIEFNLDLGIGLFESQNVSLVNNRIWNNWRRDGSVEFSLGLFSDDLSSSSGEGNQVAGHQLDMLIRRRDDDGNAFNLFSNPPQSPETNCSQIIQEFPTMFVTKTPEAPDPTEPYCGVLLSMLRSLPLSLLGRITQVIFEADDEEIAGLFTGVGVIRVLNVRNLKFFAEVFYHEAAHAIQSSAFDNRLQADWIFVTTPRESDPDFFAATSADFFDEDSSQVVSYGTNNQFEDFATTFQAYTRDTFAMLGRAKRIEFNTGKTVLLDKMRFVSRLIRLGSPDIAYRSVVGWNTETGDVSVQIQTAEITLEDSLPTITGPLLWNTH